MNNWDDLFKLLVPLVGMAIWALTSLLNREAKPGGQAGPPSRLNPPLANRPRPGEPTLRFGGMNAAPPRTTAPRPASRSDADEIVILSSSMTSPRSEPLRGNPARTPARRPAKGRPSVPERRVEPTPARANRLAGVSQNVNQQLANTSIEMSPLGGLAPLGTSTSLGLKTIALSAASAATAVSHADARPVIALTLADPARIREAFILNEILQPPVALRSRRNDPRSGLGAGLVG